MNVKANLAVLEIPQVDDLYVFPSCGDESNSIGAAFTGEVWKLGDAIVAGGRGVDVELREKVCASTWTAAASATVKITRTRWSETSISTALALGATAMVNLPCSLGYTAHALVPQGMVP